MANFTLKYESIGLEIILLVEICEKLQIIGIFIYLCKNYL